MAQLTIRDVPTDIAEALRADAEARGISLNAVVRSALVEYVGRLERLERLRQALPRIDEIRAQIRSEHGGDLSDSTALIREDRDSR